MSYDTAPFMPFYGPNAGIKAGGLTASVTITGSNTAAASALLPGNVGTYTGMLQIQIANTTSSWAYCNFSRNTAEIAAATVATGYPVAPGAVVTISVPSEVGAASIILGTAPGTLTAVIFTRGIGV